MLSEHPFLASQQTAAEVQDLTVWHSLIVSHLPAGAVLIFLIIYDRTGDKIASYNVSIKRLKVN